jgi:ABC-type uncharacterized transport system ATPase subunit
VDFSQPSNRVVTAASSPADSPALELRGVLKRFGALVALDGVDLVVRAGTVHAVLGENGAGKSTLMRIAYGLSHPDRGVVRLFGMQARHHSVRDAVRAGVGMVQQHPSLVPSLSPEENLVLGGRGLYRPERARTLLQATVTASGLPFTERDLVRDLDIVDQQRLEILKALSQRARLLILDEPTAVLAPSDSQGLLRWIRQFANAGGSVVLVTHKLREALSIADDVTVLRRGRVTLSGRANQMDEGTLAAAMFPDATTTAPPAAVVLPAGDEVVAAADAHIDDHRGITRIRGATFTVRRHEIVGVAGVEGAGHRELLLALAGVLDVTRGTLRVTVRRAMIPADRQREAIIPDFSLTENVALHDVGRRRGIMPWRELTARTAALIERFAINASSPGVRVRTLSGGNQQRLVIGRELDGEVDLVVADNPTRGLDIRASAFVHEQLRAAVKTSAVIVHTPDVDELLSLASRVLVVFNGHVREVSLDREAIGRAMVGADSAAA